MLRSWQAKYSKVAAAAREIFAEFDPDYESCSLDEAYLDVTDHAQLHSMSGGTRSHGLDHRPSHINMRVRLKQTAGTITRLGHR